MNRDGCEPGKNCTDARDLHEHRRHPLRLDVGGRFESHHTAFSPISSVRIRTACSTGRTNTFPSPILPVLAAATTTLTAFSTMSSPITTSTFTLGRKSTVYSLPRYISVCPFCRPKPLTSVTVIPSIPSSASASLTSSSLNGLMMASSFFMSKLTQHRAVSRNRKLNAARALLAMPRCECNHEFFAEQKGHPEPSEGPLKVSKIMDIRENRSTSLVF